LIERGWVRVSFADAVRELAMKIDPLVTMAGGYRLAGLVAEEGWAEAKKNPDVRRLLQNVGTGAREVIGDGVWVSAAEPKVVQAKFDGAPGVVFTDTRFPNEVDMIRDYGGSIIRITRPGVGPVNGHISETAIDSIEPDFTIINDATPEALQAKLICYAESLVAATA
jgi:hypothetical protein